MTHKWAKEIKAWADGAEIQVRVLETKGWGEWHNPTYEGTHGGATWWYTTSTYEYRVKPEPLPNIVMFWRIEKNSSTFHTIPNEKTNVKCVFDSETGKLKAVELLT